MIAALLAAQLVGLMLAAPAAPFEVLRLRDGSLIHGTITSFDEASGVTVSRLDTGGVLELRWEHFPAEEVKRIKASRGFTGEDAEPWLVDVVHLIMRNGTTETGVLQEGGGANTYVLRRRGSVDSFSRHLVRTVESAQVEGLEVFGAEELYLEIVASLGPPSDASQHLELAIACEGAKLYEAAKDHFLAVREQSPKLKVDLVNSRLAQIAIKLENAAETAELDRIRSQLYKKRFAEARALAAEFRLDYPGSRQLRDLDQLEADIDRKKTELFSKRVVADYFGKLEQSIDRLARDTAVSLDVARDLCDNDIHPQIVTALAQDYAMPEATVAKLWEERSGGSVRTASYGDGTFILGKEKALSFGRVGGEEESQNGAETGDDFDDLVEKVKKQREALVQQRKSAARSGGGLEDSGPTPDEWWTLADSDARRRWLTAYYCEFAGAINVIEAKPRDCRRCNAVGTVDGTNEKSEPVQMTCPVCKGLKQERVIRAR